MEIDLLSLAPADRYKILSSLVTPRPIAWVTTVNPGGQVNAAPFSFFNVFGSKPPILALAPGDRSPGIPKDTAANIRATGEFVVQLVTEELCPQMVTTAEPFEAGINELEKAGLTTAPSKTITPPRIAEAPVAFECKEHQTIQIGSNRLVLGLIQHLIVPDGLLDSETFHLTSQEAWTPIGRMASPNNYCRTSDLFQT